MKSGGDWEITFPREPLKGFSKLSLQVCYFLLPTLLNNFIESILINGSISFYIAYVKLKSEQKLQE